MAGERVPVTDLPNNVVPESDVPLAVPQTPAEKAVADYKARGWGSGAEHAAYQVGQKATDLATALGASPDVAGGAGVVGNLFAQLVPAAIGGVAGKNIQSETVGKWLMQSSVKPVYEALKSGKGAQAIETLLQEGIPATKGGAEKLSAEIGKLSDEVSAIIANSSATIPVKSVLSRLRDTLKMYRGSLDYGDARTAVQDIADKLRANPLVRQRPEMAIQDAQTIKQQTYRELGDKSYGAKLRPAPERDAMKDVARGLREEVAAAEPAVGPLNAREGSLINARNILERRVAAQGNMNPIGLGGLIFHGPENPMFWAWMAERWPWLKSSLGIGAYSGSIGRTAGAATGATLGVLSSNPEK